MWRVLKGGIESVWRGLIGGIEKRCGEEVLKAIWRAGIEPDVERTQRRY